MQLLSDIIPSQTSKRPEAEAVCDPDESLTYAQLAERVNAVARGLHGAGIAPGDRVAVVMPNSVDFIVAHFGVLAAGAISVPCEPGISEANLSAIRESCEPKLVLRRGDNVFKKWIQAGSADAVLPQRKPSDVAALMYTTGTTGRPKGVMLTHANIFAALRNICEFVGYTEADREVVVLPLSHNFGLGHIYCNLLCGGAIYTEPGLTRVGRVLKKLRDWGATGFPGTPLGFVMLMDRYGDAFRECASGLRFIVVNSAPLPPERAAQLQELLPEVDLMVYYGLTEASRSTFISLSREGPGRYRSVGRAMPEVCIEILDTGEMVISGPTVTSGYWNDPGRTAEALPDGRLRTGDLGQLDEGGYLTITGRIKDMINVGGYKVNPEEVERVLASCAGVADAGVAGDDKVHAFVVTETGSAFDAEALTRHCFSQLESYKVPAMFHQIDRIPRTDTGKPRRGDLLKRINEEEPLC